MILYTWTNGAGLTSHGVVGRRSLTGVRFHWEVADNNNGDRWSRWAPPELGAWGSWCVDPDEQLTEAEAIAWLEERAA